MEGVGEHGVRKRDRRSGSHNAHRGGLLRKHQPEHRDAQRGKRKLPFAFATIGEPGRGQCRERIGGGDDDGIGQRSGDGDPLRQQERRHPTGKAVIADHLKHLEHDQHHRALEIGRAENLRVGAAFALDLVVEHVRRRQRTAGLRGYPVLDHPRDPLGLFGAAMLGQPAWRFGQRKTQEPGDDRAARTDHGHAAPS